MRTFTLFPPGHDRLDRSSWDWRAAVMASVAVENMRARPSPSLPKISPLFAVAAC